MGPVVAFAPLADGACVLLLRVPLPATTRHVGAKVSNFLFFPTTSGPPEVSRRETSVAHIAATRGAREYAGFRARLRTANENSQGPGSVVDKRQ